MLEDKYKMDFMELSLSGRVFEVPGLGDQH